MGRRTTSRRTSSPTCSARISRSSARWTPASGRRDRRAEQRTTMRTVRDPLWSNIHVDPLTMRLVDTPGFQRLRYVRQLGLAHLVYPGATHTRFEHALGAYHLARRTLDHLEERGDLARIEPAERGAVLAAALLHDV